MSTGEQFVTLFRAAGHAVFTAENAEGDLLHFAEPWDQGSCVRASAGRPTPHPDSRAIGLGSFRIAAIGFAHLTRQALDQAVQAARRGCDAFVKSGQFGL